MYAKLLTDIIKPANDATLENYLSEVYEQIALNVGFIRNQLCVHAGRLAKVEPDNDNEFYWKKEIEE